MRRWFETVYSIANLYIPWTAIQTAELIQKPSGRKRVTPTVRLTLKEHIVDLELFAPTDELHQLLDVINGRVLGDASDDHASQGLTARVAG